MCSNLRFLPCGWTGGGAPLHFRGGWGRTDFSEKSTPSNTFFIFIYLILSYHPEDFCLLQCAEFAQILNKAIYLEFEGETFFWNLIVLLFFRVIFYSF